MTTTSQDVKDIQDRQAGGRDAVLAAAYVSQPGQDLGTHDVATIVEAAMMALVEHWRAEAQIWEDSKRRGGIGTAKELRQAASRLAGFAVGLTTRPTGVLPSPAPPTLDEIAQDARSIIEQVSPSADSPNGPFASPCAHPHTALSELKNGSTKCTLCGDVFPAIDPATELTGDEPVGTQVVVGGVEFTKIGTNPFSSGPSEEDALRQIIGPLGANTTAMTTIMDNPFLSPKINGKPVATVPFFALAEIAAKLEPRETVSHSYVEGYERCSLSAMLSRASRRGHIGPQRPGWSLVGGSAFHAAVLQIEQTIVQTGLMPIIDDGELWLSHFEKEIEARRAELTGTAYGDPSTWYVSGRGKEGYDWWRIEGARMLATYVNYHNVEWRRANQTLMVRDATPALELEYSMTVRSIDGQRGHTAKGFIDRAVLSLGDHPTYPWHVTVVDYKTGARDPKSTFQLGEYAHALMLEMGLTEEPRDRPILGSYWLARKGIYTTPVPVIARHPLHELQYRYDATMRGTTAGVFAPNLNDMCVSCGSADYCPALAGRL